MISTIWHLCLATQRRCAHQISPLVDSHGGVLVQNCHHFLPPQNLNSKESKTNPMVTPPKINPVEKEKHLPSTSMTLGSKCEHFPGRFCFAVASNTRHQGTLLLQVFIDFQNAQRLLRMVCILRAANMPNSPGTWLFTRSV